jgi:hypothetical protein
LEAGYYREGQRLIVSGGVFDESYYNQGAKTVAREDFEITMKLTTSEKLYRLAKYFYTEAARTGNEDLIQRPACCFCLPTYKSYNDLMKRLEDEGIINFIYSKDDGGNYAFHYLDISMTSRALIAFEDGIETPERFKEVLMDTKKGGDTNIVNNLGPNSQLNQAIGHASTTATQNNNPNMAELQTLFALLLQAAPKDTAPDQLQQIKDGLDAIREEMKNPSPRKGLIKTILAGFEGVIKAADFFDALSKIRAFFGF